jgi:membrane protein
LALTKLADVRPWWTRVRPTVHYLLETEAHVYALATSASVLLAFYPFLIVVLSFFRDTLHWKGAELAVYVALSDFFAGEQGQFLINNLSPWMIPKLDLLAMLLLLFTANGVFEPLEVALNRAWGVTQNRSYLKNQLVSLGFIFVCGSLAILSLMFTGWNRSWIEQWGLSGQLGEWAQRLFFKLAAIPLSVLALFLIYWKLPNRKVEAARVAPVALVVGLALEALKYVNLLIAPFLARKLAREYMIFQHSVTILLWSFVSTLVILAGAHWTARHGRRDPLS